MKNHFVNLFNSRKLKKEREAAVVAGGGIGGGGGGSGVGGHLPREVVDSAGMPYVVRGGGGGAIGEGDEGQNLIIPFHSAPSTWLEFLNSSCPPTPFLSTLTQGHPLRY